jgi:hypothetical protein
MFRLNDAFFDKYLTYIANGFFTKKVFMPACKALSIGDRKKECR